VLRFAVGEDYRHAKFAARLLARGKGREEACEGVVNVCFPFVSLFSTSR
jgi:hypothetical protein